MSEDVEIYKAIFIRMALQIRIYLVGSRNTIGYALMLQKPLQYAILKWFNTFHVFQDANILLGPVWM